MPEQPEVRIMSDYFNYILGHQKVIKVEKSPISKNKCDLSRLSGKLWNVRSEFRGKEMMIILSSKEESHKLKIGFARIGSLHLCDVRSIPDNFDKVAMLRFYTDSQILYLYDFTRFSIWKWSEIFDPNRSPDIVIQHNEWRDKLYFYRKNKFFKRPVFEAIIDQRFFNGIGNFSRSEILARTKCSPFMKMDELLESDILRTDFFEVCRDTLNDIALLGGFQHKYWKNPFGIDKKKFNKWVRCYNKFPKSFYQKDSSGRMFWFEKKNLVDYVEWAKKFKDSEVHDTRLLEKIYKYHINKYLQNKIKK